MEVASRVQTRAKAQQQPFFANSDKQSQTEESGTETESRARRKFQKASNDTNDNVYTFRKPSIPASTTRTTASSDAKQTPMASRRKVSLKENRVPLGPRPFETPSKRVVSDHFNSHSRSFLPTSTSEPAFDRAGKSNDGNYPLSFGQDNNHNNNKQNTTNINVQNNSRHTPAASLGSFDFLPPGSFDDFQTSITSYESSPSPLLNEFPNPGAGGGSIFGEKSGRQRPMASHKQSAGRGDSSGSDVPPVPSLRGGNTQRQQQQQQQQQQAQSQQPPRSPHRYSNAARASKMSSDAPNGNPSQTAPRTQDHTLSLRTRRQTQAAAAAAANATSAAAPIAAPPANISGPAATAATRPPRKSLGPGLLGSMLQSRRTQQDQSSNAAQPAPLPSVSRTPSLPKAPTRRLTVNGAQPSLDISKSTAMKPTTASKLKSIQHLPRHHTLPDLTRPELQQTPSSKSITKPKTPRPDSPSSTDKRKSGRISGLGARTISPTDTARMRRLSMKAVPAPSPVRDLSKDASINVSRSPSLIPRKTSATPSSRETPDTSRAPLLSLSLSRSPSYQSIRAPSAGSARTGQNASTSKLPTPKSRNVYSSADRHDGQELVPPVPAIPKAYESPKDLLDSTVPFFAGLKTPLSGSLSGSLDSTDSALPRPTTKGRVENPSTPSSERKSYRHGAATTTAVQPTENPHVIPPINKKALQPLRLPPLSLQPLSTPTAVRINSLPPPQPARDDDQVEITPPPRRYFTKTPSTPMTASKATFYRPNDDEPLNPPDLRSNTSHFTYRGLGYEEPNEGVPLPSPASNKRGITPFTSGSLPKSGANHNNSRPRLPDEYTLGSHDAAEPVATKPMGPRARTTSKSIAKDSASIKTVSSSEDQELQSAGNSLRRKLSLGWRKTPKVPRTPTSGEASQDTPPKYDMPPPKLPASATFADFGSAKQPAPDTTRVSLDVARRKPSVGSNLSSAPVIEPAKPSVASIPAVRQMHNQAQRSSSWSILGSNHRNAAPKPVPAMPVKTQNKPASHLDKDDVAANDEMRRLSAKRRDVDVAARETDELRKQATRKDRMTPAQAIQSSAGLLNIFEKGEIIDYKEGVYFCGRKDAKKHVGDISAGSSNNFGYDDERGDYNIVLGDHLAYRYEVIDVLGKGSFGQVVRCIDHKHGGLCAIKIIRNKKRFHQQALVEVNILNKLRDWDPDGEHATLTITSSFYFRSHLCITSPCLSINLYELIRAHGFTGFSLNIIRRFSRQILTCLCLLQTKRVIHCDLKPENILLCDPRRADVRVIDFGSSCKADEKVYTYIQSRFYRSPEVILGSEYGMGIDMWSVGCILAELYTGYPIFPGENEQEQLSCIMEIFGPPSRDIIEKSTRRKLFFDSSYKPRVTVSSKGRRRRPSSKTLSGAIKCDDEAFLDFLVQCLRWDPDKRLRPDQALSHPFITNELMRRERPRVRQAASTPGVTGTAGVSSNSPVKRTTIAQNTATSFNSTSTNTPARSRPLPDTPLTAMKNTAPISNTHSPLKAAPTVGRRQSLVPGSQPITEDRPTRLSNTSNPVAGSKRTSNGSLLADRHQQQMQNGGYSAANAGSTGLPRVAGGKVDLAGAAARESMGAVNKWR